MFPPSSTCSLRSSILLNTFTSLQSPQLRTVVKIHAATGQKTTAGNILSAVWHTPVEVKGQTAGMDETDMPSSLQVYPPDTVNTLNL